MTQQSEIRHACYSAKAAADGAVLFYIDQCVSSRVARTTYGVPVNWNYDDPRCSRVGLARKAMKLPSGATVISGGFRPLLLQVIIVCSTLGNDKLTYVYNRGR